ncbi:hypothetical protein ACFSQ3_13045 [Sphingobacterium corticis]|uniref:Uncharacterized protein n=1 Tax=Sphingobacterium corticis TaxID=1812823 RepID=A0ABW5NLH9_9SPHI
MIRINLKPLSVNKAWQGRRFKTDKYKAYEKHALLLLPPLKLPQPPYQITIEFGLSNVMSDWDNPVKPLQDILQKKYGFNDKDVLRASVEKTKVAKGEEYFEFQIDHYDQT